MNNTNIEKILNALELSEAVELGCSLSSAECGELLNYVDALQARIAELEAYIDELENPQSIPDACTCEDNPQDETGRSLYIDHDCPIHGEVNNE
jgi:hypothetical protein